MAQCEVADSWECLHSTRLRCFACGDAVCSSCSRVRRWYRRPNKRVCLNCERMGDGRNDVQLLPIAPYANEQWHPSEGPKRYRVLLRTVEIGTVERVGVELAHEGEVITADLFEAELAPYLDRFPRSTPLVGIRYESAEAAGAAVAAIADEVRSVGRQRCSAGS